MFFPNSWLSVSGIFCCRSRDYKMSSPHPLSLLGVAVSCAFLRRQAQLLAFQHWGDETQSETVSKVRTITGLVCLMLPWLIYAILLVSRLRKGGSKSVVVHKILPRTSEPRELNSKQKSPLCFHPI